MKSIIAAFAALAVSIVSAQSNTNIVSITAPLEGTVYTAGKPAIISWINPSVQTIPKIVLAKGAATSLQPITTIAQNVDASKGSYTWNIPADTTPGNDYAFELGNSPNVSYTGHFTIQAANGSGGNSTQSSAAASGSHAPTGTAAASGSSSASAHASVSASASGSASSASPLAASGSVQASGSSNAASSPSASASSSSAHNAGFKVAANPIAVGAMAVAGVAVANLF